MKIEFSKGGTDRLRWNTGNATKYTTSSPESLVLFSAQFEEDFLESVESVHFHQPSGRLFGQESATSHETDNTSLPRFLDVMCRNDDRLFAILGYVNQMVPDTLTKDWVDADRRLVQDQ